MPALKRVWCQLQEEESGSWHLIPQISCCILGLARETGLTWKEETRTSQEFRPPEGAINSQSCQRASRDGGRGTGKEQWKRKLSVISPGEGLGHALKCQRKNYIQVWWE